MDDTHNIPCRKRRGIVFLRTESLRLSTYKAQATATTMYTVGTAMYDNYMAHRELIVGIIIGLVVGGVAGYFIGGSYVMNSINNEIAGQEKLDAKASVNPFEDVQTNPLENVKTNPYKDVKTNPFE